MTGTLTLSEGDVVVKYRVGRFGGPQKRLFTVFSKEDLNSDFETQENWLACLKACHPGGKVHYRGLNLGNTYYELPDGTRFTWGGAHRPLQFLQHYEEDR